MHRRSLIWIFLSLIGIYVWLSFSAPVDTVTMERLGLSHGELLGLQISLMLPIIIIWLSALYGYIRLLDYANSIKGAPESGPLALIGKGLMVLAFGLPIASIASIVALEQGGSESALLPISAIARNYFQLIFPLIAFCYIASGTEKLVNTTRTKPNRLQEKLLILFFIIFACAFTAFIIDNPFTDQPVSEIYYLPTWLVIVSIVVPYLFTWYNGLLSGYYILRYKNHVKGHVYKHAFGRLATGLLVITAVAIIIRVLTTLNEQLTELELSPLLLTIYALVIIYGLGYFLVASGSKRLSKLEEV